MGHTLLIEIDLFFDFCPYFRSSHLWSTHLTPVSTGESRLLDTEDLFTHQGPDLVRTGSTRTLSCGVDFLV